MHQLGCHLGKSLGLALGPAVFNGHILTLDEAGLLQALAERAQALCVHVWVFDAHKSNYWNSGLLRARSERPRCSAAKKRDELAPSHVATRPPRIMDLPLVYQVIGCVHRSKERRPRSESGLGCAKTPAPAAHVETSRRNCAAWSRIVLRARCSIPCWRIVFSTFRNCMSFHTGWVRSVELVPFATFPLPPRADVGADIVEPPLSAIALNRCAIVRCAVGLAASAVPRERSSVAGQAALS